MLQQKVSNSANKKALIICIDSTIGYYLNLYLKDKGWTVYGTTRKHENISDYIFFLDLNDYKSINIKLHFDAVYLCLGLDNMDYCERNEEHSKLIIVDAQIYLCKYFSGYADSTVVLSTTAVFDGDTPFVLPNTNKNPKTIYGMHKAIVEDVLLKDLPNIIIARITKVIPPSCDRTRSWIHNLSKGITIDALNDLTLCPISVHLATEFLEKVVGIKRTGIHQLSGNVNITYYDVAKYLASKLNVSNKLINTFSYKNSGINQKIVHKYYSLDATHTNELFNLKVLSYQEVLQTVLDQNL